MTVEHLLFIALATWYISYAMTATHGPFGVFEWLRTHVPHGGLLSCPVCLAIWVAFILTVIPMGIVIQALAIAGLAMLLHGYTGWRFGN